MALTSHISTASPSCEGMPVIPGVVDSSDEYWTRIADLRFGNQEVPRPRIIYHISYGSWKKYAAANLGEFV